jgi:hypothetical protein
VVKIELVEGQRQILREAVRMVLQPLRQSCVVRHLGVRRAGGDHVHFLRQPLADHRIALVEAQAQRLAIEHLFPHPCIDQRAEFGPRRRAAHDLRIVDREPRLVVAGQMDRAARRIVGRDPQRQDRENRRPRDQKMHQWLSHEPFDDAHVLRRVNHIGDE